MIICSLWHYRYYCLLVLIGPLVPLVVSIALVVVVVVARVLVVVVVVMFFLP